jgi:hypothetical protein
MQINDSGELVDTDNGVKSNVAGEESDERQAAWDAEVQTLHSWNTNLFYIHGI